MQYFLPFWPGDDIHEEFEPWRDKWRGRELRIWEVKGFSRPPVDGVLVSLFNIINTNHFRKEIEICGIHKSLNFNGIVMGDCGAFSYVNEPKPPYSPVEVLEDYRKWGFNIGVTVDHLMANSIRTRDNVEHILTKEEKEERWHVTIRNAKMMIDEFQRSGKYDGMRLVGVTQGHDKDSYALGVRELLEYGFDYIGLGGLARKPTSYIERVLYAVAHEIREFIAKKKDKKTLQCRLGLHLFGVARVDLLRTMIECGVSSFDSASPLRMAWTSSRKNYMLADSSYTAIRIRLLKGRNKKAEEHVIQSLEKFSKGELSAGDFLKELVSYSKALDHNISRTDLEEIRRTLITKPWERCSCPICREIGIHVCVFRRCERNMRRGFHNVYEFRRSIREKFPRILALTWCTTSKKHDARLLPAYERYSASTLFRSFWDSVRDLPVEIGILSAKYMLIDWATRIPDYNERLTTGKLSVAVNHLKEKFAFYDKIFFIGLGTYRQAVEKAVKELASGKMRTSDTRVEIFPKKELARRGKIDIIEYNRQITRFRETIKKELEPYMRSLSVKDGRANQYEQTQL